MGIEQFLIVCPLTFLAGFVDAIAGGGGLISLPAFYIAGLPIHSVLGTNKMSSCMGTSVATFIYARKGFIPWKQCIFYVVCALLGSGLGASIALLISAELFTIIMVIILPVIAFYVMRKRTFAGDKEPYPLKKTILIGMASAFTIGLYDGFYGPGTGTFLLLLLTGVAHMKLSEANGVTKVINLSTNVAALAVFLVNGVVLVPLGLVAGAFNILGNFLGARSFVKGGVKVVKPIMMIVLIVFFIRVLTELFS